MQQFVISLFLIFVLALGCVHVTTDRPFEVEEAVPRELDRRFVEGMNRKNLDQVMGCYWNSPDLFLVLPDATVIRGWNNVREAFQGFLGAHESVNLTIDEVSYVRAGDGVIAVGTVTFRLRPKEGSPYEFTARWSDVRRNMGGRWFYVLDHAHALAPPKQLGT